MSASAVEPQTLDQMLASAGAPPDFAPRIAGVLGDGAAALLAEDPWLILAVPGVRPDAADGFARAVLGGQGGQAAPSDPRRGRALIGWLLERAALDGHTAQPADVLCSALGNFAIADPAETLRAVLEDGDVLAFSSASEDEGEDEVEGETQGSPSSLMISREKFAFAEEGVGESAQRLLATPEPLGDGWASFDASGDRIFGELRDAVGANGLVLVATAPGVAKVTQIAEFAVTAAATGLPVSVVGGNAQSVRTLSTALDGSGLAVFDVAGYLASVGQAPSADVPGARKAEEGAAESASEGEGVSEEGSESASDAEPNPQPQVKVEASTAPIEAVEPEPGLVVVAHAHLLDVEALSTLLEAVPEGVRVVLAGDPSEPGPAGPGQPFKDLYDTRADALMAFAPDGRVPRVKAADSEPHPLTDLRFALREGELPPPENDPEKRLVIVPVRDGAEADARAVQLAADSIPRQFGLSGSDIQVVAIRRGGDAGADGLTKALQDRLGTSDVRALTAREALGGTWPAAVVVLDGQSSGSLTRALVYGLCGLGERHLSIVHGAGSALPQAVANIPDRPRHTRLPAVLREL